MSWQEFPWQQEDPDPRRDRLCTKTGVSGHLDCRIEGANFIREQPASKDEIVVCAYNAQGGDLNTTSFPRELREKRPLDPTGRALVEAGFEDAHAARPPSERVTHQYGVVLDQIFGRGVRFTAAGVGPRAIWRGLSDHLPVWASVHLS
jgi:endonuclease/exonuclease/phosphatase family metal-dependent hydrolase